VIEFSDFFAFAMGCIVALVGLSVYNNRNSQLFNKKGKKEESATFNLRSREFR